MVGTKYGFGGKRRGIEMNTARWPAKNEIQSPVKYEQRDVVEGREDFLIVL